MVIIGTVSPNGMSVRVDDENGVTYKYNGASWVKKETHKYIA
jgi:hypothetical protein